LIYSPRAAEFEYRVMNVIMTKLEIHPTPNGFIPEDGKTTVVRTFSLKNEDE
jgi:hypothetical protein